jgi:hypothetical protein
MGQGLKFAWEDGTSFHLYNKEIKKWQLVSDGELSEKDFIGMKEIQ